jgi:hypothetical protein
MYVSRLLFHTIPGKTNEVDGGGIEELFAGQLDGLSRQTGPPLRSQWQQWRIRSVTRDGSPRTRGDLSSDEIQKRAAAAR